jgi:chromosome segregation ATPase
MANLNLHEQNESLDDQIRLKKAELKALEASIKERDSKKKELWADSRNRSRLIRDKKAEKNKLDEQVRDLRLQYNNLEPSVKNLSLEKSTLESAVQELQESKNRLTEESDKLQTAISDAKNRVKALNLELERLRAHKSSLQNDVQTWQRKSDLYTNDIEGISEAHKRANRYYLGGAAISGLILLFVIALILHRVWYPKPMDWLKESIFSEDHTIAFYLLILLRASTIAALIIVTFIFLNLTKNFVSQFIRTEGRMNSIRSLLFLLEKIKVNETELTELSEEAQLNLEKDSLNKQVAILQDNLPIITTQAQNSFDKVEKLTLPALARGKANKESV